MNSVSVSQSQVVSSMESTPNQEVINIYSTAELLQLTPSDLRTYNFKENDLRLNARYRTNFPNICKILKATTTVKSLHIFFNLDAANLQSFTEAIIGNSSIEKLAIFTDRPVNTKDFQSFSEQIKHKTNLKNFGIQVYDSGADIIGIIDSLKNIYMPTPNFSIDFNECNKSLQSSVFHEKLIELLQTTNINRIQWSDSMSIFEGIRLGNGWQGFDKFCQFMAELDRIKSFVVCVEIDAKVVRSLARVIARSKNLHTLAFSMSETGARDNFEELFTALAVSQIKRLTINGLSLEERYEFWSKLAEAIKSMKNLTNLTLDTESNKEEANFVEVIGRSESLRKIYLSKVSRPLHEEGLTSVVELRNRKLQNERVASLIILVHNIARGNSLDLGISRDIWPIIFYHVSIPGVSLDFGRIAHSVFKNNSIRRVIYKTIRKNK